MHQEPHGHPQVIKVGRHQSRISSGHQKRARTKQEKDVNGTAAVEVGMVAFGEVLAGWSE
jgi:hypothetical protein